IGLQFIAKRRANLVEIRGADLLAHLDQEFGVKAEPPATRRTDRAQRRQVDAVLPLVVSGAAAVDAIFAPRERPWIKLAPPLAGRVRRGIRRIEALGGRAR